MPKSVLQKPDLVKLIISMLAVRLGGSFSVTQEDIDAVASGGLVEDSDGITVTFTYKPRELQ